MSVDALAFVMATIGTLNLPTVLAGEALFTIALPVNTATPVIAIHWTEQLPTVETSICRIAYALSVHTKSTTVAVFGAVRDLLRTVFTDEALLTNTGAINAATPLAAVFGAASLTAVFACPVIFTKAATNI